jgi:hypothetical protein
MINGLTAHYAPPFGCAACAMRGFDFGTVRSTDFINSTGCFMSILDYLAADQIMVGVAGSSKKQLIEQLAGRAAELTGLCQRSLFKIVMRHKMRVAIICNRIKRSKIITRGGHL